MWRNRRWFFPLVLMLLVLAALATRQRPAAVAVDSTQAMLAKVTMPSLAPCDNSDPVSGSALPGSADRCWLGPQGERLWLRIDVNPDLRQGHGLPSPRIRMAEYWNYYQVQSLTLPEVGAVTRLQVRHGAEQGLVYYWYQVGGLRVKDEWGLRWAALRALLTGHDLSATCVRVVGLPGLDAQTLEPLMQQLAISAQ